MDLKILMENPEIAAKMRFEISGSDMLSVIQSGIESALNKQSSQVEEKIEKPISQADAIKYLGKSRQTLISWRKKGIITGHTLGGRVYFLKSELLSALQNKK